MEEGEEGVCMLSVGDHDFSTSDWIVDEAVASLKRGRHHYSASGGEKELKQAALKAIVSVLLAVQAAVGTRQVDDPLMLRVGEEEASGEGTTGRKRAYLSAA